MIGKYVRFVIKNYLFAVISMAFAIAYWLSARNLPEKSLTFAKPVLVLLIPVFIWNIVKSIVEFRKVYRDTSIDEKSKWDWKLHITKPKIIVTVMTILYVVLLQYGGFILCTAVYLGVLAFYLGIRKPLQLILFVVIYTAAVYAVFGMWLNVRLPRGILF